MKKITKITEIRFLLTAFSMASVFTLSAQSSRVARPEPAITVNQNSTGENLRPQDMSFTEPATNSSNKTAITNCTDKINFCGSTLTGSTGNFRLGGYWGFNGLYEVFPAYKGTVLGVEFTARRFSANIPTFSVQVLNPNSSGYPGSTTASPAVPVSITAGVATHYTVMFPSPVAVTGNYGFSIGIFNYNNFTDSCAVYNGANKPVSSGPYYSFLTTGSTGTYSSMYAYFNFDADFYIRPIVSTSVNASWVSARTSTGCALPANFSFTNTSGALASYSNHPIINPQGTTKLVDFGDTSPIATFNNTLAHSYTVVGNYIADFTQTYKGWTDDCVETETLSILVDDPIPSFNYGINGLAVTFTNTSQNLNNFVWNFGDLTTSTQQNPGTHTFPSPGTYVVELEGTAPCGKVTYAVSIVITGTTVGLDDNKSLSELISVYPNPANNFLKINTANVNSQDLQMEIFNSIGASVKTISTSEFNSGTATVDVSGLPKGIYFVKFKNKNSNAVKSFIKE